jgi:hypothetical protein
MFFITTPAIFQPSSGYTITIDRAANLYTYLAQVAFLALRIPLRATPTATRDLGFSGLIRSRLLRHTRGCGKYIPTRILTGPHSVAPYDTQGDVEDLF